MSTLGTFALASAPYHTLNTAYKRACLLQLVITSTGAALAVDTAKSAPGFTVTTGANGAFTGTMPRGARAVAWASGKFATASNVGVTNFSALDANAGTFACQHHNDGAETILASGDEIWLTFLIEGG